MKHKSTTEKGDKYDTLMPLLEAMFREFQDLAKKNKMAF